MKKSILPAAQGFRRKSALVAFLCGIMVLLLSVGFYGSSDRNSAILLTLMDPNGDQPANTHTTFETDRTLLSPLTDQDFERCIEILKRVSDINGNVGMEEFIVFLEMYSGRELFFDDFQDLPTPYVLIFYAAACSVGEGCGESGKEATISLTDLGNAGADGVLHMFCQSVKDMSAVQLLLKFQFQIRNMGENDAIGTEQILSGSDGSEIILALEQVIEDVLKNRFGCKENSRRDLMDPRKASYYSRSAGRSVPSSKHVVKRHSEPHGHDDLSAGVLCDYKVNAVIHTILPSVCLFDTVNGNSRSPLERCALVSAEISVIAASLHQYQTIPEVRSVVVVTLKEAFNRDISQLL